MRSNGSGLTGSPKHVGLSDLSWNGRKRSDETQNLPSVLVRRGPELLLFDCGEGTQRQFLYARAGINRKMRIFISHVHGDHVFGLPGIIHSL